MSANQADPAPYDTSHTGRRFHQGSSFEIATVQFLGGALFEVVDYRGDVAVFLNDGSKIEGFVFNANEQQLQMYPKDQVAITTLAIASISKIEFIGADPSKGKTWEDWQKKAADEKKKILAAPITTTSIHG